MFQTVPLDSPDSGNDSSKLLILEPKMRVKVMAKKQRLVVDLEPRGNVTHSAV